MKESLDRRMFVLGTLGVAGAALAACSSDAPEAAPVAAPGATPTPSETTSSAPAPTVDARPRWPLTGKLLTDPDDAHRAAVAVKVPDNKNEHPQVGLDQADIVFVELDGYRDSDGYSATRLVPVFHSRLPEGVGPVRSIRPVDIPLLSPITAVVGNTGASGWVLNYVEHFNKYVEGGLSYMETRGTGSYSIDPNRVREYQGVTYYDRAVVCHPRVLAKQTKKFRAGPPAAYFPFITGDELPSTVHGRLATSISVPWKQGNTYNMSYEYDKGTRTYPRSMPWGKHVLADGTRVAPDNVLVIKAKQHYDKIYKGSGHDEPIHDIIDTKGTFAYFHGGKFVTGYWSKGSVKEPFTFTLTDSTPLKMALGQTYVELPQSKVKLRIKA